MNRRDLLTAGAAFSVANFTQSRVQGASAWRVPAEEAPHQRTFMMWPVSGIVYPDKMFLQDLQSTVANIANTISDFEPVTMLAARANHVEMRRVLSEKIELWDMPTEDLWARDAGPLFTKGTDGSLAVSHIRFNGWGGKQVHRHDKKIAARVAKRLGLDLIEAGLTGEAGGVDQDGLGMLLAQESSWVVANRNPGLSKDEVETRLLAAYGADQLIWSPGVRGLDITDYHIDSLARFTAPGRVLINMPIMPDPEDPFHVAALQTRDSLVDAGLEVEIIPEPVIRRIDDIHFVASYANYYVCNNAVIAAEFGDPQTDAIAADALARHYPGREIVILNANVWGPTILLKKLLFLALRVELLR